MYIKLNHSQTNWRTAMSRFIIYTDPRIAGTSVIYGSDRIGNHSIFITSLRLCMLN